MSNVINFPSSESSNRRASNQLMYTMDRFEALNDTDSIDTSIFANGDDQLFIDLLKEWPCFQELQDDLDLQRVFEQYYDDELSLSQDCVLEFIFHMYDPDSSFDISNALYTWEEEDRNYFLISIGMHAELISQIKKEEL